MKNTFLFLGVSMLTQLNASQVNSQKIEKSPFFCDQHSLMNQYKKMTAGSRSGKRNYLRLKFLEKQAVLKLVMLSELREKNK